MSTKREQIHIVKKETPSVMNGLREQLQLLLERAPHLFDRSIEEREVMHDNLSRREEIVLDRKLPDLMAEYGINLKDLELSEIAPNRYRMNVRNHFSSDKLPQGYAYKGGAARALLLRSLGLDAKAVPRDLDIIRRASDEPFPGADDEYAQRYMPDDFAMMHRVELVFDDRLDFYFSSRDITLNEVFATDTEVIASRECILDTIRHIIRPTRYELEKGYDDEVYEMPVNDRTLSRILRFYSAAVAQYDDFIVEDVNLWDLERYSIDIFDLALQFDRAIESGTEVAEIYLRKLKEYNQISKEVESVDDGIAFFQSHISKLDFYFRHAPRSQFQEEYDWIGEEYEDMPKRSSHRKVA